MKLHVNSSKLSDIQSSATTPAMSEGEATAGEMSDGAGGKKKTGIKLRLGGSASPSRAGSPMAGSRAGSPTAPAQAQGMFPFSCTFPLNFPSHQSLPIFSVSRMSKCVTNNFAGAVPGRPITAEEVTAALPAEGIAISTLLKHFSGRIKGNGKDKEDREKFIKLVKENSVYSQEDKLLRPKRA